jgi:hypothetical protein
MTVSGIDGSVGGSVGSSVGSSASSPVGSPAGGAAGGSVHGRGDGPDSVYAEVAGAAQGHPAFLNLLQQTWWWCVWGALLAALGWRVPSWKWPPTMPDLVGFVACAAGFALLATPVRERPIATSARAYHVLLAHRNAVVSAGFVVLAAMHAPNAWEPAVDAVALAAYLLMLDAFAAPPAAFRQLAGPWVLGGLTVLIGVSALLIELPGADEAARQVTGIAAAGVALAAALWAGFGVTRRR